KTHLDFIITPIADLAKEPITEGRFAPLHPEQHTSIFSMTEQKNHHINLGQLIAEDHLPKKCCIMHIPNNYLNRAFILKRGRRNCLISVRLYFGRDRRQVGIQEQQRGLFGGG
ncbi:hypothetical protein ACJX0J_018930, partial [Zea mays]